MIQTKEKQPVSIGNYLVGVLFACLAFVQLLDKAYLDASVWGALALSFASFGNEGRHWADIPPWRKAIGLAFLASAAALFVARVAIDFGN